MFVRDDLPELGPNLIAALARLKFISVRIELLLLGELLGLVRLLMIQELKSRLMIADKHEEAFSQVFDVIKQGNPGYITKIRTKLYV